MKNINSVKNCYGCGVCARICPKKIISIQHNKEGFYEPFINNLQECTNCSLCTKACAYLHTDLAVTNFPMKSYAGWSNDKTTRLSCSSGGIGFEIAKSSINHGYKVCTVKYDEKNQRAEHYIAETIEDLEKSKGSKYIQSYTLNAFIKINRKDKYLITGTPCQIDSFRRYIKLLKIEENFILMDFFCHGVPSILLWKAYLNNIKNLNNLNVLTTKWRDKKYGWHDSWMISIKGEKYEYESKASTGDYFYQHFLGNNCLGKACYLNCKYKYDKSSADIRIGDLWGKLYKSNEEGVSAVITFTQKGNNLLQSLSQCSLKEHSLQETAEGQMKTSPAFNEYKWKLFFVLLRFPYNFSILKIVYKFLRIFSK